MERQAKPENRKKPKFQICIEGALFPWDESTITVPQIRELGGLPEDMPVIEIDLKTNAERTLAEDEVIEVKPGMGFGKKVCFKRGADRVADEVAMLTARFSEVEFDPEGAWVRIRAYRLGTNPFDGVGDSLDVAFQVPPQYPAKAPYGFYTQGPMRLAAGGNPDNYQFPVGTPFGSDWGRFSWPLDPWQPAAAPTAGSNLVGFAQSFADRLRQGK